MGSKKQRRETNEAPAPRYVMPPPNKGQWPVAIATLVGVGALIAMTFSISEDVRKTNEALEDRLDKLDSRIAKLADKVDKMPAQAAARPRRGPDPNKVYKINTIGAPTKGPANAAVTIAEFSDFQ